MTRFFGWFFVLLVMLLQSFLVAESVCLAKLAKCSRASLEAEHIRLMREYPTKGKYATTMPHDIFKFCSETRNCENLFSRDYCLHLFAEAIDKDLASADVLIDRFESNPQMAQYLFSMITAQGGGSTLDTLLRYFKNACPRRNREFCRKLVKHTEAVIRETTPLPPVE